MVNVLSVTEALVGMKEEMLKEIKHLEKILEKSSDGNLFVRKRRKKIEFYHICKGESRYLSKKRDKDLILELGDKRYAKQAVKNLRQNVAAIESFLKSVTLSVGVFLADEFEAMGVPTTKRTCLSQKVRGEKWLENKKRQKKRDMQKNPGFFERYKKLQIVPTFGGDMVRSKSEGLIADMLFANNIPYIYEARLDLGEGRYKYPDFTIYDAISDREIVFEHFGRMDDPGYVAKNFDKVELCVDYGLHLGNDFFITFETKSSPLTAKIVAETMENFGINLDYNKLVKFGRE